MIETEAELRKWGNSFGLVISKKDIERENLKEGERLKVIVTKKGNILRETFGTLKVKRTTEEMLKEADRELDIQD